MSAIPKVIYLTSYTKDIPSYVIDNWVSLNPEYTVKLYDDDDCIAFLESCFDKEHADIFRFIKDGPIKADFWRVCILYHYGGVYSDIDIEPLVPIDDFLEKGSTFLTCDSIHWNELNPHFIAATRHNHILKQCIEQYIHRYRDRVPYSYWGWSIVYIMSEIIHFDIIGYSDTIDPHNKSCMKILRDAVKCVFSFLSIHDICVSYTHTVMASTNMYQFLDEHVTYTLQNVYCTYKGKRIINNRYKNYNRKGHKFV